VAKTLLRPLVVPVPLVTDPDPQRAHAGYEPALFAVRDFLERGGMPAIRTLLARLAASQTMAAAAPGCMARRSGSWRRSGAGTSAARQLHVSSPRA